MDGNITFSLPDNNYEIREKQADELIQLVEKSQADFIILGGDFNADPEVNSHETTLKDINDVMVSAVEEFFKKIQNWLIPKEATYGNPKNSYSSTQKPVHYDYIFHKAKGDNKIWTSLFDVSKIFLDDYFIKLMTFSSLGSNLQDIQRFRTRNQFQ